MNIKKISFSMTTATLFLSPLLIITSCSSVSYEIMIPKILSGKEEQINTEVKTDGIDKWINDRSTWTKEQWLMVNYPQTGYISGGNVLAKNILNIKVFATVETDTNGSKINVINFYIELDKNSLNRFIDNKTEWTATIKLAA